MLYCPHVNVVGRRLLAKLSRWLENMRNSKGSEGGGSIMSAKFVDSAQYATQITHRVVSDTITIDLTQETKDEVAPSFERSTALESMLPRGERFLEIDGG
jgi:hypothetical protein